MEPKPYPQAGCGAAGAGEDAAGLSLYGWAFSGFMLAMVVSLTIGGGEVDRVGPWRPYVAGIALFALGLAVARSAPNMPVLIAGRVVQGFGAGFSASVLYATIGRALRLALGVGALTVGFERWASAAGSLQDALSPTVLPAAGLAGAGFVVALPALRALSLEVGGGASALSAAVFSALLLNVGFFGIDAFLPRVLVTVREVSLPVSGLVLTTATISWIAAAWLQARLAPTQSRRVPMTTGSALMTAGVAGVVAAVQPQAPLSLAFLAWGLAGAGMGRASPTLTLVSMEAAPPGEQGASTSLITLAGTLGIGLGSGVGGVFVSAAGGGAGISVRSVALQGAVMAGALGVAALGCARRVPHQGSEGRPTRPQARPEEGVAT